MFPRGASRQFHEFIPIPDFFFTTTPEFYAIMENWLSYMIITPFFWADFEFLQTTFIYAFIFPRFGDERHFGFLLFFFLAIFLLHFFIKIVNLENLRLLFLDCLDIGLTPVISEKLVLIYSGVDDCAVLSHSAIRY
jgi:hypothetical protein